MERNLYVIIIHKDNAYVCYVSCMWVVTAYAFTVSVVFRHAATQLLPASSSPECEHRPGIQRRRSCPRVRRGFNAMTLSIPSASM